MSIEQTLERLALAIEGLNERLDRGALAAPQDAAAPAPKAPRGRRAAAPAPEPEAVPTVVEHLKPAETPEVVEPEEAPAEGADAPAGKVALDYVTDIQQPAMELVRDRGRQALVTVLEKLGARTARDVAQKDWPALAAAIQAARQ